MKWRFFSAGLVIVYFFAPSVQAHQTHADIFQKAPVLPPDPNALWDSNAMRVQQVRGSFLLGDALSPFDIQEEALSYWWWKVEFDALQRPAIQLVDHRAFRARPGAASEGWLASESHGREEHPAMRHSRSRHSLDPATASHHAIAHRSGAHPGPATDPVLAAAVGEPVSETAGAEPVSETDGVSPVSEINGTQPLSETGEIDRITDAAGAAEAVSAVALADPIAADPIADVSTASWPLEAIGTTTEDALALELDPLADLLDPELFADLTDVESEPYKLFEPGNSGLLVLGLLGLMWLRRQRA